MSTQSYSLKFANPNVLHQLLAPIFPSAIITVDSTNQALVVTANRKVNEMIAELLGGLPELAQIGDDEADKDKQEASAERGDVAPEQMTDDELRRHVSALTEKVGQLSRRMKELEDSLKFRIVPADKR